MFWEQMCALEIAESVDLRITWIARENPTHPLQFASGEK